MIKNTKLIFSFFYFKSIIFFLAIFISQVNSETSITAKSGDTLFKLSNQYGIPLKELMHKNNINDANKIVEGKVIIIPLKDNNNGKDFEKEKSNNDLLKYKVKEGDTLYKIARDYNVSLKSILSINNIDNEYFLKPNQIILLPKETVYKKANNEDNILIASKKVSYHQTSKEEELSYIAKIHKVPIEEIISLNQLNSRKKVKPNTKLKIRRNKTIKWLKYGSLLINWSDWIYLDGNYITQAKSIKNKSFFLAISCEKRALNNTLKDSYWTSWYFPNIDFEFKIINDFCEQD
ncbi:LysM peptidoglycan-binding domain-containing protein [Prochlorococcus marinus]|uniref:Peptigoglycan-binding protein LysM n=1 Tax=Prochlorococcus marinus XMU1408 TaxID=2213228 RepID=A0A318RF15_PROMR|nr:LysM peptidoglycan-binding domain-containing protein [Prochlorococcus marinus]MBW3041399.1 peptigoglycan-binding protein LysM [Prochlorococcus marinus str. XMU1408]PYE02563.1 peptigoglycan-binding protein LysM [Prochlorococcus marinus XMU1408]